MSATAGGRAVEGGSAWAYRAVLCAVGLQCPSAKSDFVGMIMCVYCFIEVKNKSIMPC